MVARDEMRGWGLTAPEPAPRAEGAAHCEVSERALQRAAGLFRAVGDPARLRLLCRIQGRCVCVSDLAVAEGEAQSTISQRLRLLRAEGLVTRKREGRHVYYRLSDDHVAELLRSALEHAAEGE